MENELEWSSKWVHSTKALSLFDWAAQLHWWIRCLGRKDRMYDRQHREYVRNNGRADEFVPELLCTSFWNRTLCRDYPWIVPIWPCRLNRESIGVECEWLIDRDRKEWQTILHAHAENFAMHNRRSTFLRCQSIDHWRRRHSSTTSPVFPRQICTKSRCHDFQKRPVCADAAMFPTIDWNESLIVEWRRHLSCTNRFDS